MLKFYPSFFTNKQIEWTEKFDVLVSAMSLLLAFPFFILLILVGMVLPFYFTHFQYQALMFRMPMYYNGGSLVKLALLTSGNLFWTWDFMLLFMIAVISPVLPAIIKLFACPRKMFRYIVMYSFVFYSMQIVSSLNLMAYFISRTAGFPVTGQRDFVRKEIKFDGIRSFFQNTISNKKQVIFVEIIFALLFLTISFTTDNIWFLTFSSGLIIGTIIFLFGFEIKLLQYIVIFPLTMLTLIIIFIFKGLQ